MTAFGPVFILGNSPMLPVDDLDCLDGRFTVGVNRILQTGFTPTVLMWVDGNLWREDKANRALMEDTQALMVCDSSVAYKTHHHGLKMHLGEAAQTHSAKPRELICNGSTGACAARWAASLGCWPVYLVGMNAEYAPDGRTDFYGVNQYHHRTEGDNGTVAQMRAELLSLKVDLKDAIVEIFDGQFLREAAATCPDRDQADLRRDILRMISNA